MAKTESTAVNELIDLVQQNGTSVEGEPAGELFDERPAAPTRVQPPRPPATVPQMRGATDVPPLPPRRAPASTATHQQIRMGTAPPARGSTIPPLPQARPSSPPPIPTRAKSPSQNIATPRTTTSSEMPAVARTTSDQMPVARASTEMPPVPRNASVMPAVSRTTSSEMPAVPRTTSSEMPAVPRTKSDRMPAVQRTSDQVAVARASTEMPPVPRKKSARMPAVRRTSDEMAVPRTSSAELRATPPPPPPAMARASSPSTSSWVEQDVDVEMDWDAETVAKPGKSAAPPVTNSSPTLPSPRITQPSFPELPKPSRPTLPMPKQSAQKLPPPTRTARASEPPPIGEPFVAKSLFVEEHTPTAPENKREMEPTPPTNPMQTSEAPPPAPAKSAPRVERTTDISKKIAAEDQTWVGRFEPSRSLARKLVIPAVAATVIGIAAGAYVATQTKKQAAPAQPNFAPPTQHVAMPEVTAPTPSPESPNAATATAGGTMPEPPTKEEAAAQAQQAEAPAPTPAPAPAAALVDIRIDSNPPGATAMLVDDGKTAFLGTTPLATSLDPSRIHDIVLTYEGRPTEMVHVDPTKQTRVEVTLGKPTVAPVRRHQTAVVAPPKTDPAPKTEAAPKADTAVKAEEGGEGTLMVSSKPPCDIFIDGKATGLQTPQRSIPLPAGVHKVTFVNATANIKKTVSVTISADKPTKLIQDLMQH